MPLSTVIASRRNRHAVPRTRQPLKVRATWLVRREPGRWGLARVVVGRCVIMYRVKELPNSTGGRSFLVRRWAATTPMHHVRVSSSSHCDCKAHQSSRGRRCVHAEAIRLLVQSGNRPAPMAGALVAA